MGARQWAGPDQLLQGLASPGWVNSKTASLTTQWSAFCCLLPATNHSMTAQFSFCFLTEGFGKRGIRMYRILIFYKYRAPFGPYSHRNVNVYWP